MKSTIEQILESKTLQKRLLESLKKEHIKEGALTYADMLILLIQSKDWPRNVSKSFIIEIIENSKAEIENM